MAITALLPADLLSRTPAQRSEITVSDGEANRDRPFADVLSGLALPAAPAPTVPLPGEGNPTRSQAPANNPPLLHIDEPHLADDETAADGGHSAMAAQQSLAALESEPRGLSRDGKAAEMSEDSEQSAPNRTLPIDAIPEPATSLIAPPPQPVNAHRQAPDAPAPDARPTPGTLRPGPVTTAIPAGSDTLAGANEQVPGVPTVSDTATPSTPQVSGAETDRPQTGPANTARGAVEAPVPGHSLTSTNGSTSPANSVPPPAPATAVQQASLAAPLASPAWQQQLGQQLGNITQRGRHQVELHLNPAELGPLSVSLKVDDQGAQAHFLSAHASVRSAVEQAIPQLREALAEQGIALGEASVGEQQRQSGTQSEFAFGSPGAEPRDDEIDESAQDMRPSTSLNAGGVDTYA